MTVNPFFALYRLISCKPLKIAYFKANTLRRTVLEPELRNVPITAAQYPNSTSWTQSYLLASVQSVSRGSHAERAQSNII